MKRITKIILSLMTVLCVAFYTVGANAQEMAGVGMRQPNMDNSMSVTVSVGDGIREKLSAVPPEEGTICFDLYRIAENRLSWGVFRDRRPNCYSLITER